MLFQWFFVLDFFGLPGWLTGWATGCGHWAAWPACLARLRACPGTQNLNPIPMTEKNAFKTKWNRREKVLDRLVDSITGIVGSIQGTGIESVNLEKIHELKYEE